MKDIITELENSLSKQDLLMALTESYNMEERLYDENLERMAHLHEQVEALKDNNKSIHNRMKKIADKIAKISGK
jgi:uncharacterized protein YaaN involved in tellurite resistance